jgi:hypothetical protein
MDYFWVARAGRLRLWASISMNTTLSLVPHVSWYSKTWDPTKSSISKSEKYWLALADDVRTESSSRGMTALHGARAAMHFFIRSTTLW